MATNTRIHINPASLIFALAVLGGLGFGIWLYFDHEAKEARRIERERREREEAERLVREAYDREVAERKEREEAERKARLAEAQLRAETERQRIAAETERRKAEAERQAQAQMESERLRAEQAEKDRLAQLEREKAEAEAERIRLQLDADARSRAIEEAKAGVKLSRKELADTEVKIFDQEKMVKSFPPRMAHAQATMNKHEAAWNDWNARQGSTDNVGGVRIIQNNQAQMELEARKYIAAKEELARLSTQQPKAEQELADLQRKAENLKADIERYSGVLKQFNIQPEAEQKPVEVAKPKDSLKTYVLKDGRQLRVQKAVDFGQEWSLKLENGEVIAVAKADVVEVK